MYIQNLSYEINKRKIFNHLNLKVHENKITAIVGPSGCGKSTLLKLTAHLLTPTQGDIQCSLTKDFIFQEPRLLDWLTVEENILLKLKFQVTNNYDTQHDTHIDALLKSVELFQSRHLFPYQLSGGMKMRTSLARSLITRPELLLCDEPFSALDEITRAEMQKLLYAIAKAHKMTLLFVTHSISEALWMSDYVVVLNKWGEITTQIKVPFDLKDQNTFFDSEFLRLQRQIQEELQRGIRSEV